MLHRASKKDITDSMDSQSFTTRIQPTRQSHPSAAIAK
jgi:hypothetical protein